MKYLPHTLVVALGAALPVFFSAMANGGPPSWGSFGQAAAAFLTTLVALLLKSPISDPGVKK